jgi:anaerobic selenocysteine-containing dehydrogenase/ferredoxin-NADP reductase
MIEQKIGFCALCKSRCGATYAIEDGRLIGAGPAPNHPTGKSLCIKGKAAPEIIYSPDRLTVPLRRTKPKTSDDPGWERIGWDEALDEIARRLVAIRDSSGAEAVAVSTTTPSGTALSDGEEWVERLIQVFGTPNWVSTTEICNWHKDFAHAFTYGVGIGYPDYASADTIVLWGFNPSSVWLDQATQVAAARARGAKTIVVDPRQFGFANGADHWLRVRPGADGILMLGIARLLIESGRYNQDFVRRWTNATLLVRDDNGQFLRQGDIASDGRNAFVVMTEDGDLRYIKRNDGEAGDALAQAALFGSIDVSTKAGSVRCRTAFDHFLEATQAYSLDQVAERVWVDRTKIEAVADAIASAKSIAYYTWTGLGQHAESTQIDRALATLMALKGSFDAPGGNVILPAQKRNAVCGPAFLSQEQLAKTIGLDDKPLGPPKQGRITAHDFYAAAIEGKPYRVRALIGFGANLAVAHANSGRGKAALQALDFYVHCDVFENPSARYADILLPVNTPWERDALRIGFGSGLAAQEHIQLRQKMIEPLGESRSDAEICFDLAGRLGLSDQFFDGDIEAARTYILAPTGLSLGELRAHPEGVRVPLKVESRKYAKVTDGEAAGFETETGLIEFYSALLHRSGNSPVPRFDDQKLAGNANFPFVLTSAKAGYFCHSQHRQIPSLRKREPQPSVELAPEAAEALGLEPGDWTEIETAHGRVRMQVKLNKSLHPRVVRAAYGWWQANREMGLPGYDPFTADGANYNMLVGADRLDPVSGAAAHRSQSCRLNPLTRRERSQIRWRGYRRMRVAAIERIADEVTAVTIAGFDDTPLPDYEPGQHIVVRWSGEAQEPLIRCYSLTGSAVDQQRKSFQIAVRFVPAPLGGAELLDGRLSKIINRHLRVDDVIEVKAPTGGFRLPLASDRPVVLVAGGIGITPFMAYLETLARKPINQRIHLLYANRSATNEAFAARIAALQATLPNLSVSRFFSKALGPIPENCREGRVSVRDILLPEFDDAPYVYMCGPTSMTSALRNALSVSRHPGDLVFEEAFTGEQVDETQLPVGPFKVTFSRAGKTVVWSRARGSLLELAEAEGVQILNGCRAGQCESCEITVLDGEIQYRVPVEHEAGDTCLACQAVPRTDLLLDI